MNQPATFRPLRVPILPILALLAAGLSLAFLAGTYLPLGIDWQQVFRPAAQTLAGGKSPYQVEGFFAAPWSLVPLIPLAFMPEEFSRGVFFLLSLAGYAFAARRLGGNPVALVAFLLSPPVIHGLLTANIDWLVLLGFTLPAPIGLVFALIKPQLGLAMAVFWLVEAFRKGGWRKVVQVFTPLILITTLSFILFGFWPLHSVELVAHPRQFNMSLWPYSLPLGLSLIAVSLKKQQPRFAYAASPFLSPHVVFHSYVTVLASLLPATRLIVITVITTWLWVAIRYLSTF